MFTDYTAHRSDNAKIHHDKFLENLIIFQKNQTPSSYVLALLKEMFQKKKEFNIEIPIESFRIWLRGLPL